MDSISQAVLGSAVALVATKGKNPKRAILVGAALGTLPDLDVLVPFDNDLDAMTRHRSWSHSWLVQIMVTPLFVFLLGYLDRSWGRINRFITCILVFVTHSGLDALTIYGTWLFWPFGDQPVMGGSTFIIDPLYTLPLLIAVVWIWRQPQHQRILPVALTGLSLSSLYLCWGLYSKAQIETLAYEALANADIHPQSLVATPTPFNSILWRVIAIDQDRFHEGYYSHLSPERAITFSTFDRGLDLVSEIPEKQALEQFARFNHNFHAFSSVDNRILGQDLRMGAEPFYFFQFEFGRFPNESGDPAIGERKPVYSIPMQRMMEIDLSGLFGWLAQRLFSSDLQPLKSQRNVSNVGSVFDDNAVKL